MLRIFLSPPPSILAIDDSKLNRAIIRNSLSALKMNVDEAVDGVEGLEALKDRKYDLILLDIVMPNLDGFGFLSKFRDIIGRDFVPVILMTGLDDLNSKIKGLRIGADDFLLKPLNEKELVARVISLLRLKKTHDELYEKNQLIQAELATAKRIQKYIIPTDFSFIHYPRISGMYLPIEDIGGDYFDCYRLSDSRSGFLIADVTGHGIPAALIMSMSKMIFSLYSSRFDSTSDYLAAVNQQMMGMLLSDQYITAFYVIYDRETGRISFTNAGHTRALYYRAGSDKILALDTQGFFIGISDMLSYEQKSLQVSEGDRLFLYTDGIVEIKNADKKEYSVNRLSQSIRRNHALHGNSFCEAILRDLESYTKLDSRDDDIAFLSIEF
jgi:serine phosphatase RsbU (regulator of sigma subunit)